MAHVVTGVLRRGGRALRSVGPATVAVTVALIIGAAGFADAATGGDFLLGRNNTDNATSILRDSTGIPLALSAPAGKSPLSVTNSTQVNRLNAQYVGGDSASQLQSTGGVGITAAAAHIALPLDTYVSVASTGPLPAGIYYASATADLQGSAGTDYCKIIGSAGSVPTDWGGGNSTGFTQSAETTVATVPANTVLTETCYGESSDQYAYDAAIMAIRITASSAGTEPTVLPHRIVPGLPKASPGVIIGPPKS
jgi:hypothetical protein